MLHECNINTIGMKGLRLVTITGQDQEPTSTLREVKDVFHQLKNNNAAGKDGITTELNKMYLE